MKKRFLVWSSKPTNLYYWLLKMQDLYDKNKRREVDGRDRRRKVGV